METTFTQALETLLAREVIGYGSLSSCKKLTAGASQETYCIACDSDNGEVLLALRRAVPTAESQSAIPSIGLETEAKLLSLAATGGIAVPQVIYVLHDTDGLGAGFLMQWLEGETLGQRITRADEFARVRPKLAFECGVQLARIHNLDWAAAGLECDLPTVAPETLVDETWASYSELDIPVPMIDYTWRWLQQNLPASSSKSLVHGDFRNGNLMVTAEGINAVLDWELAHIGDPMRDLGYLCVNSWRFGQRDLPVGGFGEIDDLLTGYKSVAGIDVSREDVHFWQVFGSFWWAITALRMAQTWRTGENPGVERPVIGRRSSEAQMDCVNLLIPGDFALPRTSEELAAGSQLPMPAELLESVRHFLREDVAATADSHTSFMARVAANALGIVQREVLHGPALAAAECSRLKSLLGKDVDLASLRHELVRALRQAMPLDTPGLNEHLRQTVAGQLAIDQPHYSAIQTESSVQNAGDVLVHT